MKIVLNLKTLVWGLKMCRKMLFGGINRGFQLPFTWVSFAPSTEPRDKRFIEKNFRKKFPYFSYQQKNFPGFFLWAAKTFFGLFFKNPRAKKKFRDIFDWREFKKKICFTGIFLMDCCAQTTKHFSCRIWYWSEEWVYLWIKQPECS